MEGFIVHRGKKYQESAKLIDRAKRTTLPTRFPQ
jgi:hypothetical protein